MISIMAVAENGQNARKCLFLVTVDTEEDGLWSGSYPQDSPCENIADLPALTRLLDSYQLKGTYLVTYPVTRDAAAVDVLQAAIADGRGEIGTHLHPWCSPPFDPVEMTLPRFPHCLPPTLQQDKLAVLSQAISEQFGRPPVSYRAGRWGFDSSSVQPLLATGHTVDSSVVPGWWMKEPGAPSFRGAPVEPYRMDATNILRQGSSPLLEVPVTTGFTGSLLGRGLGPALPPWLPGGRTLAAQAGFTILRPALHSGDTLRRLVRQVMAGHPAILNVMLHSSELSPGHSPYAPDTRSRDQLLERLRTIIDTAMECCQVLGTCLGDVTEVPGNHPAAAAR